MNREADINKTGFTVDIDLTAAVACVAVGFLTGFLANYWWAKRRARRDADGDHHIALTFPFL